MAKILEIADGRRILAKYDAGYAVDAEHDVIYAGPEDISKVISADDKAELERLGWFISEDVGRFMVFT
jgi:hypothetical protein